MPNVTIPNPEVPLTDPSWYLFFYSLFKATRCDFELRLGGILENSIERTSSNGAVDTDLVDYTFEKNQLKNDKDCLFYSLKGIYAANANNKKIVLKFGSQTIFDTTALAVNDGTWIFEVEVIRTGAATQDIFVKAFYNDLARTSYTAGTQDLSDNIEIKLTATGVTSGDIESKGFRFDLNPID